MNLIDTIEKLRRPLRKVIDPAKTLAMLLAAIFICAQVPAPVQAQNRVGRQPADSTTPQKNNPVGGLADKDVYINFERIGLKLFVALQNKNVGYGVAVFHNGKVEKYGSGGYARRSPDQTIPFAPTSRVGIASCTKTVTAIAVLKALEAKGKDDSELIYTYLPTNWKVPQSVKALTFKDVLSHHSGLKKVTDGTYEGLRKTIEAGVSPDYKVVNYDGNDDDYQNINFALCRVLLPYIVAAPVMRNFENDPKKADEMTAQAFCQYVREQVFYAAGINKPVQFKPWDESGNLNKVPLYYNYESDVAGLMDNDGTLTAGPGGLFISAIELAQVMAALENGKLLSLKTRLMMKAHNLGIFKVGDSGYWTHSGGYTDGKGRGVSTRLVLGPYNIQVAIVMNSANNDLGSTFDIVKNAIEDSVSKP